MHVVCHLDLNHTHHFFLSEGVGTQTTILHNMLENMRINAANEIDDLFLIPTANGPTPTILHVREHAHKLKINVASEIDDLFLIPTASGAQLHLLTCPWTSNPSV